MKKCAEKNNIKVTVWDNPSSSIPYIFMAWNKACLDLMMYDFGNEFSAFLTYQSGVDNKFIDLMRLAFDKGIRPVSLLVLLLELHPKKEPY